MTELIKITNKYFSEDENSVEFFQGDVVSKKSLKFLAKFFPALTQFEMPDMYSINGEYVLVMEHFEFDSSHSSRKGSLEKREQARINRKFNNVSLSKEKPSVYIRDAIISKPSFKNYKDNFLSNFDIHYKKIPEYKDNLLNSGVIDNNKKILTAFFIEDTSCLGNFINTNGKLKYINLFQTNFFINKALEIDNKLDYIFYTFYDGHEYRIWFLDMKSITYIRSNFDLENGDNYFAFTPNSFGCVTLINNEEFNKDDCKND